MAGTCAMFGGRSAHRNGPFCGNTIALFFSFAFCLYTSLFPFSCQTHTCMGYRARRERAVPDRGPYLFVPSKVKRKNWIGAQRQRHTQKFVHIFSATAQRSKRLARWTATISRSARKNKKSTQIFSSCFQCVRSFFFLSIADSSTPENSGQRE